MLTDWAIDAGMGSNGRHGAAQQSQHVYSWVGDLGISCTQCPAMLQLELLAGKR